MGTRFLMEPTISRKKGTLPSVFVFSAPVIHEILLIIRAYVVCRVRIETYPMRISSFGSRSAYTLIDLSLLAASLS